MAEKRQHYWVYHRAVMWRPGKYEEGPSLDLPGRYVPEMTERLGAVPWCFVDDVWAKSAEKAVEIVQERLRKKPGGTLNLAPPGAVALVMSAGCSLMVDWTCGPEPEPEWDDDPED